MRAFTIRIPFERKRERKKEERRKKETKNENRMKDIKKRSLRIKAKK